jgi:hypothetical protein
MPSVTNLALAGLLAFQGANAAVSLDKFVKTGKKDHVTRGTK